MILILLKILLKPPGGDHRRPTPPRKFSSDVGRLQKNIDRGRHRVPRRVLGKFSASSRHTRPKSYKNLEKMESQTLQNRGPRPPKSSPEPFKTPFLKTSNLRRLKMTTILKVLRPKCPTWLHVGGPRPSKIEAGTRKNRC